jgi:hypothetical protein
MISDDCTVLEEMLHYYCRGREALREREIVTHKMLTFLWEELFLEPLGLRLRDQKGSRDKERRSVSLTSE